LLFDRCPGAITGCLNSNLSTWATLGILLGLFMAITSREEAMNNEIDVYTPNNAKKH